LEGQLGIEGGCLWGAPAAHQADFNEHARTFFQAPFLEELTQEKKLHAPFQRELSSMWVKVSSPSDVCCIKCGLSKQVRVTPSDGRSAKEKI